MSSVSILRITVLQSLAALFFLLYFKNCQNSLVYKLFLFVIQVCGHGERKLKVEWFCVVGLFPCPLHFLLNR